MTAPRVMTASYRPLAASRAADQRQLEGPGNPRHDRWPRVHAVAAQPVDGPVDQAGHDRLVEPAGRDGDPQSLAAQLTLEGGHDTPPSSSRWPIRSRLVRR